MRDIEKQQGIKKGEIERREVTRRKKKGGQLWFDVIGRSLLLRESLAPFSAKSLGKRKRLGLKAQPYRNKKGLIRIPLHQVSPNARPRKTE